MEPTYFATPEDFRKWFIDNHEQAKELLVGFYKKGTQIDSITWPESVDQALCFGWIDGVRRSVDGLRYSIRFTPRRKNSHWSLVNLKRIVELDEMGLLMDAGRKVWMERNPTNQGKASFEQGDIAFTEAQQAQFQAHPLAWENWNRMVPSYRKPATWWVISAKQAVTQAKRLQTLIECSAENRRISLLTPSTKK